MAEINIDNDFEAWRIKARLMIGNAVHPETLTWSSTGQGVLFNTNADGARRALNDVCVTPDFISLASVVADYDDNEKWVLLYRILFRIVFENRNLLKIESDPDVRQARMMEKAVRRDVHKFHAFVRFRRVECDGEEVYVAWHEPQHFSVERSASFFERRFGSMRFSIFTPKGCAHWDLKNLTLSQPVDKPVAPKGDEMQDLWLLYYSSIFNPFRLKVKAMKREFPRRHWPTLPEASLIPDLIRKANEII